MKKGIDLEEDILVVVILSFSEVTSCLEEEAQDSMSWGICSKTLPVKS